MGAFSAMQKCTCGNMKHRSAVICPHCGKRGTRREVMAVAVLFAAFMLFGIFITIISN
jgi:hypothetical protein